MKKHLVHIPANPQFGKSRLATMLCGALIGLILLVGCEAKQKIDHLKVGRDQLLNSGLAVDAVKHLKQAEIDETDKTEPRVLLVLAYSHGLSSGTLKVQGLEAEFKNERAQRLAALGEPELEYLLQILARRSRIQKDAIQVLIDKGVDAIPSLINALGNSEYQNLHSDIIEILYQNGSNGLGLVVDGIQNADTPTRVKVALIRLIGRIGEPQSLADLETIRSNTEDAGVQMEISVTLYRLGKHEYSATIISGLNDDDVNVRRAAARAMVHLNDYPVEKVIKALQDTDDSVITYAAEALQNQPNEQAVGPLTEALTGTADNVAKQAVSDALQAHAERKLTRGLTAQLVKTLISGEVENAEDRLRILQLFRKDALLQQIRVAALVNPQLAYDLDQYLKLTETHQMVKGELRWLLSEIE